MANKGYISQLLNGLPLELRAPLQTAFHYVMDNWRFGDRARAENAQLYRFSSTTAATANQEFTIAHGLGYVPHLLIPTLDLSSTGGQTVSLRVSRVADGERIYLASASTSVPFQCYVE